MHPIMSDHDIATRQFEQDLRRRTHQQRLLVEHVAHQNGRLGPVSRLTRAIHRFIDPRGFALRQVRLAELARDATGTILVRPAIGPLAPVDALPAPDANGGVPLRDAA